MPNIPIFAESVLHVVSLPTFKCAVFGGNTHQFFLVKLYTYAFFLVGKCIASQVNATFFSISASSLTSKWVGI